jgi:hypothetical protein
VRERGELRRSPPSAARRAAAFRVHGATGMAASRRVAFEHDGHRFETTERESDPPAGGAPGEPRVRWVVRMDGAPVLEFAGPYPYRDDDVRKRVVEWYEIQKPRMQQPRG